MFISKIIVLVLVGERRDCYSYTSNRRDSLSLAQPSDDEEEMIDLSVLGVTEPFHRGGSRDNDGRYLRENPPGGTIERHDLSYCRKGGS